MRFWMKAIAASRSSSFGKGGPILWNAVIVHHPAVSQRAPVVHMPAVRQTAYVLSLLNGRPNVSSDLRSA